MANKMLIDSSHPEETRVVVTRGNKVEEFDFESANRRQLRGNIYLAKVTRVEPSLQAAFVEYGGNRHGFLAFSEIHPDYYQIPVADRQALIEAELDAERDQERDEERRREGRGRRRRGAQRRERRGGESVSAAAGLEDRAPEDGERQEEEVERSAAREDDRGEGQEPRVAARDALEDGSAGEGEPELPLIESAAAASSSHDEGTSDDASGESLASLAAGVEGARPTEDAEAGEDAPAQLASHGAGRQDADEEEVAASAAAVAGDVPQASEASQSFEDEGEDGAASTAWNGEEARAPSRSDEEEEEDDDDDDDELEEHEIVENVGGADALEEVPERPRSHRRNYKIQEVIKRRQILLVQVVKEERGNKGAALTTYLSLAGRYSVLMPNTGKGGGISRKITSAEDRKRLKEIVQELEVPDGMGIILRTAGASRTKPEIKRDYEYLMRLWESVRELTLESTAPSLVYEEGSLIKRAIRDLYNKDIDGVVVAGEEGYREAQDFMRMIMPSHAKAVTPYREPQALFAQFGIEAQLDAMFSNHVTLRSGGYLVINPTEALVSIDVNSGRSTREHNIEDTALRTNLEASEEIARQLRLRDLAGAHRHRLHRHGGGAQQPRGREEAQRLPQERPRPHPGRPHIALRAP